MAGTQVQRRRGTTAEHAAFTGALGELTVDTTKKTVVVHDGSTAGGFPLAREANVFSGTYTPTLTNTTNISSSTAQVLQYMRVGNTVTVAGSVDITATAVSAINIGISLPIASALTTARQLGGSGGSNNGLIVAVINGDAANDRAILAATPTSTSAWTYYFAFTYQVL
jgi:hypothetical protein